MNIGEKVYFGRSHGEQTLGEVVKINRASIKVRQLEQRGTMKAHKVGTIWKVAPALVHPAGPGAIPAAAPAKRDDAAIMSDILDCYCGLSPENLSCDGEASPEHVRRRGAELNRKLLSLFNEIGRPVSESEAYASDRASRVA
jgi:hypothetical protein